MISKISIFLSLITYVYYGNLITARKVFIVSSYFNTLNLVMVYFWPVALTYVGEGYVSVKRLQEFLLLPETKQITKSSKTKKIGHNEIRIPNANNSLSKRIVNLNSEGKGILLENATAAWNTLDKDNKNGILNVNIEIQPSLLCALVGKVGSGKSTLLNAILGELEIDSGRITVNGSVSYASQEAWLFEGTVRDNIVFVEGFDERRYNQVIGVCALEQDFQFLPKGDQTVVGERGVSLSGGQRARVNLARAIYKQADIYLLDDPLSAVDTHVG